MINEMAKESSTLSGVSRAFRETKSKGWQIARLASFDCACFARFAQDA